MIADIFSDVDAYVDVSVCTYVQMMEGALTMNNTTRILLKEDIYLNDSCFLAGLSTDARNGAVVRVWNSNIRTDLLGVARSLLRRLSFYTWL